MSDFYSLFTKIGLALVVLAVVLTIVVFRKRWFERGPRQALPADPEQIKRENPPDARSRSHRE